MHGRMLDPKTDAFDMRELMGRCLGNLDLVERSLAKFHSRLDEDLCELDRAAQCRDLDTIALVAHRLKGTSANMAAHALRDGAARLEEAARRSCLDEIPHHLEKLRNERSRFESAPREVGPAGNVN
jgi:HPt (histidine-containing phosphotransfer) domain-containing protein